MATPTNRTPIKLARGSYSNLNSSLDDIQEGEIIYAEDQNKLYVKEGPSLIDVTGGGSTSFVLDQTAVTDGSVIYYSSSASEFKADAAQTLSTIVDGGSF